MKARASHLREFCQMKMCSGAISSVTEFLSLPWDLSLLFSFVLGHMFVLFHKVALPVQVRKQFICLISNRLNTG